MFFDDYPRFYETSETLPSRARLNLRYEAIIAENLDILDGARVLDIASHDGRWSLAALASGAKSVVGIEGRPELVEHSVANLEYYGYGPDEYRFLTGDVHKVLTPNGSRSTSCSASASSTTPFGTTSCSPASARRMRAT